MEEIDLQLIPILDHDDLALLLYQLNESGFRVRLGSEEDFIQLTASGWSAIAGCTCEITVGEDDRVVIVTLLLFIGKDNG